MPTPATPRGLTAARTDRAVCQLAKAAPEATTPRPLGALATGSLTRLT